MWFKSDAWNHVESWLGGEEVENIKNLLRSLSINKNLDAYRTPEKVMATNYKHKHLKV
jgi:hypothetical protein